jgi:2-succinyl-6-hydroxy-2,4-cyclohexadiene-1-carboxylate synthase
MGGRMALHLALSRPDLVRSLVLVGATAGLDDGHERAERRRSDEALAAGLESAGLEAFVDGWLSGPLFARLDPAAACRDQRLANRAEGLAASLRRCGTGAQEPLWDRLGEVGVPVLVVAGECDTRFVTVGQRLVAAIGSNARLWVAPGAGHAAHLEAPAAVAGAVSGFLAASG